MSEVSSVHGTLIFVQLTSVVHAVFDISVVSLQAYGFEAHSDYLRSIAVHPTQPYVLTSSGEWNRKTNFHWLAGLFWDFVNFHTIYCAKRNLIHVHLLELKLHCSSCNVIFVCLQMICWSNFGTGIRNGSALKYLRATLITWCRLSSIPRITTSLLVLLWTEQSR